MHKSRILKAAPIRLKTSIMNNTQVRILQQNFQKYAYTVSHFLFTYLCSQFINFLSKKTHTISQSLEIVLLSSSLEGLKKGKSKGEKEINLNFSRSGLLHTQLTSHAIVCFGTFETRSGARTIADGAEDAEYQKYNKQIFQIDGILKFKKIIN